MATRYLAQEVVVIYFAFQFPAATEYAPSKQTVARCSRKLVSHTQVLQ